MSASDRAELISRLRAAERREAVAMSDWSEARIAGYDVAAAASVARTAQAERERLEARLRAA